jgi:polyisoprenoid-binding protein YceI
MKKSMYLFMATALFFVSCKNEKAADAKDVATETEAAIEYKFVPAESTVEWLGSKPTGDKHNGTISISYGAFQVENGQIVSGNATLDMNTITVLDLQGDEKGYLEGHLKGVTDDVEKDGHFFSVKQFPTGKFEVTGYSAEKGLEGNLTLKGMSKSISFPVNVSIQGDELTLTSEKFTINRTDWDIKYGSGSFFKDLAADKIIKDEIELSLKVVARK